MILPLTHGRGRRRLADVAGSPYLLPPTKSPGDALTSALWNSYIRDNLDFGVVRPIAYSLLTIDAASIDVTSIAATSSALRIVASLRSDRAATLDLVKLRLNNDTGNNYQDAFAVISNGSVSGNSDDAANGAAVGEVPAATAPANTFGPVEIVIPDYANGARHKGFTFASFGPGADAIGANMVAFLGGGRWKNVAAANRVTLLPYFGTVWKAGSSVAIYSMGAI